ncbi:MAG TPA: class I SAM-dependent methyltransferase [Streptosporangiaceae bacterium]|jgi:SAM-dependent methyltransferase
MREPDISAISHDLLTFKAPLSDAHAAAIIGRLGALGGAHVLDLGCGRGELLRRVVAADPGAYGTGVDVDEAALAFARTAAAERGLAGRVRFDRGDAAASQATGDVVLCVGARHAWPSARAALAALRDRLRPGGRLLFADAFWTAPPTAAQLDGLGAEPDELGPLPGLVDAATGLGYRLLDLSVGSEQEWDAFESGWCAGLETWLLRHPGHPGAAEVRRAADAHRDGWLRGYRGAIGFAYLVLAVPGDRS